MINLQEVFNMAQQFKNNPTQFMAQRGFNIPDQYMKDPNTAIQYLMNNGKINQYQYNMALQQMNSLKNNPLFKQLTRI